MSEHRLAAAIHAALREMEGDGAPLLALEPGAIAAAALAAVDPRRCTEHHLHLAGDWLYVGKRPFDLRLYDRLRVFGAGKGAVAMARGIVERLGDRVTDGIVVTKSDRAELPPVGPIQVLGAGHPLPDARSLEATRRIADALADTGPRDLVLAPISGGASALLCEPAIALDDLRRLVEVALREGLSIEELNAIRRGLDRIKAGGLARLVGEGTTVGLVLSDVIGDPLPMIGSGPTVPVDPSTLLDELALASTRLERLTASMDEGERVLEVARAHLALDPLPPRAEGLEPVFNLIVGSNGHALEAAGKAAAEAGLPPAIVSRGMDGEAREVGARLGALLAEVPQGWPFDRPGLLLAGGETTVTVRGEGIGGRNLELALAAVPALDGVPAVALVALATDGDDGTSRAAGAVVTGLTAARARERGCSVAEALTNNDAAGFFHQVGGMLEIGPTGTNVGDLVLLFAAPLA